MRLESYESLEYQALVRSFLGGRFENTAFCLLAPDGKRRLSGSGRGPHHGILGRPVARQPSLGDANGRILEAMHEIARQFKPTGTGEPPLVQDFHSVKQSLDVAAADQRLLLLVVPPDRRAAGELRERLRPVAAHDEILGRIHIDFVDPGSDAGWREKLGGDVGDGTGFLVVAAGEFGLDGQVAAHLPATATGDELRAALVEANEAFAAAEKRKVYAEHVYSGRQRGIVFDSNLPYGEDRDGDGVIDHRGGPPPPGPR